jgi:DnaJ-class molecular chaperone
MVEYASNTHNTQMTQMKKCWNCDGTGHAHNPYAEYDNWKCGECGGTGRITYMYGNDVK